ncbi:MAG: hypothetical protein M3Q55_12040 [Acidobacteriota bacterium]|nr:hypothetical protein [Acidobacteriota bacterium]
MTASKAAVALAGLALTLVMAWPVVVAPSARIFGTEIDGRHHDPYTVMWQFEHAAPPVPYRQPLVDDIGRALAPSLGAVAAFNVLVLASFPLSVLTAFALARHLRLSNAASTVAALAFAFAPPHLAHAAYHPHIAQTQWLPLYFLALWASVDRLSAARAALLLLAGAALALSNLYSAFIAAVLTPVAIAGAIATGRDRARNGAMTLGVLMASAATVLAAVWIARPTLFATTWSLAFPRADVARYGAQWFAYFVPAVDHPLWGDHAARLWAGRGMTGALVEQQVSLSWAVMALAAVAIVCWWKSRVNSADESGQADALRAVPMLATVAAAAFICSLAPAPTASGMSQFLPASWLHGMAPMFRAYARFAFVTHLMIALLAGIGSVHLWRRRRLAAVLLLAIAAVEYAPLPPRSHDVLPTSAHRWLAGREPRARVLDCVEPSPHETLVPWLMQQDLITLSPVLPSCDAPGVATQATALGVHHILVRKPALPAIPAGFVLLRDFDDASLYDIVGADARIAVVGTTGFSRVERSAGRPWQWMARQGGWTVQNPTGAPVTVSLELDLAAFGTNRHLAVSFDEGEAQIIEVLPAGSVHQLAAWRITPGTHRVMFRTLEPAGRAPGRDARALTIMLRDWRWRE